MGLFERAVRMGATGIEADYAGGQLRVFAKRDGMTVSVDGADRATDEARQIEQEITTLVEAGSVRVGRFTVRVILDATTTDIGTRGWVISLRRPADPVVDDADRRCYELERAFAWFDNRARPKPRDSFLEAIKRARTAMIDEDAAPVPPAMSALERAFELAKSIARKTAPKPPPPPRRKNKRATATKPSRKRSK